jgi:protoporphyrinogen oxidase
MKVCVLGGGITGVTAALLLARQGHEVACLEADARPGGLCRSEIEQGFVMDRSGGHILFSKDKEVLAFLLSAIEDVGATTCKRATFIHYRGRLVQYPFENGLADLEKEETFACLRDYLEAHQRRKAGEPEPGNFHDWCLWRFGEAICRLFMHPYNRKLWNVDLHELGTAWVAGRVPDAPADDVIRSALGIRTEGYAHQAIFHYPKQGGFESIVKGLVRQLPPSVLRMETPVRRLERVPGGWRVDGVPCDRVVSTIPLPELARVAVDLSPGEREDFEGLDSMSVLTIFFALRGSEVPPHSWIYFPHDEDGPQNRITYLSNYSPLNAPPGHSSIMAEVTYPPDARLDLEETTAAVALGLERTGFLRRDRILFSRTFRNRYGYILYRRGLEERLERVRGRCRELGLDLAGRFGNYSYFNSDACVRAAMDLAASYPPPKR